MIDTLTGNTLLSKIKNSFFCLAGIVIIWSDPFCSPFTTAPLIWIKVMKIFFYLNFFIFLRKWMADCSIREGSKFNSSKNYENIFPIVFNKDIEGGLSGIQSLYNCRAWCLEIQSNLIKQFVFNTIGNSNGYKSQIFSKVNRFESFVMLHF